MRNSLSDSALSSKFSDSDKSELGSAVDETLKWLEANASASKEEFEFRMSEMEKKVNPIMTRVHKSAASNEPSVEELD